MSNPHRGPVPILRAAPAGRGEDTLRQLALLVDMAKQAGKLREDWLADPEVLPTIRIRTPFLGEKDEVRWAVATYAEQQWTITPMPVGQMFAQTLTTVPIHHVVFVLAQAERAIASYRDMFDYQRPMPVRVVGEVPEFDQPSGPARLLG